MKTKRLGQYAKWLVSGTSYLYIKNYLDKQDKVRDLNHKKSKSN